LRWFAIEQNHQQFGQIIATNPPRPTPNGGLVRKSEQEIIQVFVEFAQMYLLLMAEILYYT